MNFTNDTQEMKFLEDVIEAVGSGVRLVSEVLRDIREGYSAKFEGERQIRLASGRCWKKINNGDFELFLKSQGFKLRARRHGSGIAVYVSASEFSTVTDRFGKSVEVTSY